MHIRKASTLHRGNSQALRLLSALGLLAAGAAILGALMLAGLCLAGLAGAVEPAAVQAAGWHGLAALAGAAVLAIVAGVSIDSVRSAFAERLRLPAAIIVGAGRPHAALGVSPIPSTPPPRPSLC